jgi:hypothetical protein
MATTHRNGTALSCGSQAPHGNRSHQYSNDGRRIDPSEGCHWIEASSTAELRELVARALAHPELLNRYRFEKTGRGGK